MRVINENFIIETSINGEEILKHIEKCGRTCYKSEDLITEDSAKKMVAMLINRGHESVLEHFGFSVRFINDRGVSHEEVRHRIASFSQESTRYCNYSNDKFDNGITYINLTNGIMMDTKMKNMTSDEINAVVEEWTDACEDAERHYLKMLELGATPQIARSVLNNSTKTEIVITANLREWRTILKQRTAKAAHPQMRCLMIPLLIKLQELIPIVFDDIKVEE
jgi:thymidylate synthase (FAD)